MVIKYVGINVQNILTYINGLLINRKPHGKSGLLCDGSQQSEIYKALLKMLKNKEYVEMGKQAENFSKDFSWENQIKKLIKLI